LKIWAKENKFVVHRHCEATEKIKDIKVKNNKTKIKIIKDIKYSKPIAQQQCRIYTNMSAPVRCNKIT